MGFIHDDDAVLREDGAFSLAAVDGVCHQQVMIADLKQKLIFVAGLEEPLIAAVPLFAVADLRYADTLPVIAAEMRNSVHVQRFLKSPERCQRFRIFLSKVYLTQPSVQPLVADIMAFSFTDDRFQWLGKNPVRH